MNQNGFSNIVLVVLMVILASMLGYVTLITYPVGKIFVPNGAKFIREFRLDFENDGIDEIVVVYSLNVTGGVQNDTGFVILARQPNKEWEVVYNQLPIRGAGIQVNVDLIKASDDTQGLFVLESEAGAGTSANWHIITKQMKRLDRKPVLDQVLNARGNVFLGYNGVKVLNDIVIETVPGYSKNAARCCPDKAALEISYRFTGASIKFVSVSELAAQQST